MDIKNKIIAVGLSGGVDSSVAACLLSSGGARVIGITMKIWDQSFEIVNPGKNACFGPDEEEDISSASKLCRDLNIPYHVIDLSKEYKETVLSYFTNEYVSGRTPNPCVRCNRVMKFGFLIDKAKSLGIKFDLFATGHYARIDTDRVGGFILKKGVDQLKDQSYFLSGLDRKILGNIMFPLGDLTKVQVKEIAVKNNLESAEKRESQDFISGGDYGPLFTPDQSIEGKIVDTENNFLGNHKGIIHYTVGQRKGLGISSEKPLYVIRIDAGENKIVVGSKENLLSSGLIAGNINLISIDSITGNLSADVKIRQAHRAEPSVIYPEGDKYRIMFQTPQSAVTPGQTVVFYDGDIVLGSGIIEKVVI